MRAFLILVFIVGLGLGGLFFARNGATIVGRNKEAASAGDKVAESGTPAGAADPALQELRLAADLAANGDFMAASTRLRALLEDPSAQAHLSTIKNVLGEVNITHLLTPAEGPNKIVHSIVRGDSIARIASRYNVPADLIFRANGLMNLNIRVGGTLFIPQLDARVVIYRGHAVLQIFDGDAFFKEYPLVSARIPSGVILPTETVVAEKIAMKDGKRVAFGEADYFATQRSITLRSPGLNIQALPPGAVGGASPTGFV
ncbi:MAG: LysM peptidoglycan-binding domain-containing protein, partial [Verrucomicrobiia bacterium]